MEIRAYPAMRPVRFGRRQNGDAGQKVGSAKTADTDQIIIPKRKRLPVRSIAQTKNACGTTSLAMVLNAYGKRVSPAQLDAKYRKMVVGMSVRSMREAAIAHGLNTVTLLKSGFDEIREHLDKNHLMIAAIDTNGKNKRGIRSHYVVINGYRIAKDGQRYLYITDPGGGRQYAKPYEEFEKTWKRFRFLGFHVGYESTLMVFSPWNDLGMDRSDGLFESADNVGYAGNQLANAAADLKEKKFKEAAREAGRGIKVGVPSLFRFAKNKLFPGKQDDGDQS